MIYVLHVTTGHEMDIRDQLKRQYFGAMVPREITLERKDGETSEREKVIFTGYVFIDMSMDLKAYYRIKEIPHVIKFLGGGDPLMLTTKEAEYIVWLSGGGKPLLPSELDEDGAVMTGPLKGHESSIVSINKRAKRARLRITLAGEPHEISLSVTAADSTATDSSSGGTDGAI